MLARFFAPVHIGRIAGVRAFHTATADFINYGPDGALVTSKVSIRTGDLGEAYVMIPPKVGRALQAGSLLTNDSALTNGSAKSALSYFHDTQHFTHELSPGYPRLVIPQQLPHQSASNMSPATLFLYGKLYTIALNGTLDGTSPYPYRSHLAAPRTRARKVEGHVIVEGQPEGFLESWV